MDLAASFSAPLVRLGARLGLYRALADGGPATPDELAERSGTEPRMVREWLGNQAAGGYVIYDAAAATTRPTPSDASADRGTPASQGIAAFERRLPSPHAPTTPAPRGDRRRARSRARRRSGSPDRRPDWAAAPAGDTDAGQHGEREPGAHADDRRGPIEAGVDQTGNFDDDRLGHGDVGRLRGRSRRGVLAAGVGDAERPLDGRSADGVPSDAACSPRASVPVPSDEATAGAVVSAVAARATATTGRVLLSMIAPLLIPATWCGRLDRTLQ